MTFPEMRRETLQDSMSAWVFDGVGQPLRRDRVPVPQAGPGQLLVKVDAVGLCHSDVGMVEGVLPVMLPEPAILGHEIAGTVVTVGENVKSWSTGETVVSAISMHDSPGLTRNGGYAEYAVLTAAQALTVPAGMDLSQAAAVTDAGVTSYTGVAIDGQVGAGSRVAVVGLGGLGMTAARIAVLRGAEVFGVEPRRDVWEHARELGMSEVVADVSELAGRGLDVVADFAGLGITTSGAIRAIRPGGRIVLAGLGAPETTFANAELVGLRAHLIGSTPSGDPAALQAVLDLVGSGDLTLPTSDIGFDDIADGIHRLARGEVSGRLVARLDR